MVAFTILFASASAVFRGFISVLDRDLFGHRRKCVLSTNLVNNVLAFAVVSALAWLWVGKAAFAGIVDLKVFVFALLLQFSAICFSFGFRSMSVHRVILISKTSDLLIPFAVLLTTSEWNWQNSLFSFLIFFCCLPLLFSREARSEIAPLTAVMIVLSLVLQGGLSPLLIKNGGHGAWLSSTVGIIFWRMAWGVPPMFSLGKRFYTSLSAAMDIEVLKILCLRSVLTVGAQAFLILAVGWGIDVVAWPILNSTGLVSVCFASVQLREHPRRADVIAIGLVTLLAISKSIF